MLSGLTNKALSFIDYVKLPYLEKEQKKSFSYHYNNNAFSFFKFTLLIIIIVAIPYFAFDYYSSPHSYPQKWIIRFFLIVMPTVICFFFKRNNFFISYFQHFSSALNFLINIAVVMIIYTSAPEEYSFNNYYVGITLIMTATLAMRIRINFIIPNYLAIIIIYFLFAKYKQGIPLLELYSNIFFLSTIAVSLILGNYLIEVYTRKTYLQRLLLNEQNKEINNKNEELKQLVEEVTTQRDEIEVQKNKINAAKKEIERKHREISQSINYATRLQKAILPTNNILENFFTDYFVFFKPKDKVSGDFYWWAHINGKSIIAAIDCTGHGVPGAFMSMLGSSLLRDIILKEKITTTDKILTKLREEIILSLKQKGNPGEQNDGMDMAIVSVDHKQNIMRFSGANNPIYLVKQSSSGNNITIKDTLNNKDIIVNASLSLNNYNLFEIKGDSMPVAIHIAMKPFNCYEIQLEIPDTFYIFSDGFADQFGGNKGKKFMYKPFKQLLLQIQDKPMTKQKEILCQTFNEWKSHINPLTGANYEQIDDVLIIGIKI